MKVSRRGGLVVMNTYDDSLGMPGQEEGVKAATSKASAANFMPKTNADAGAPANTGTLPPPEEETFKMPAASKSDSIDSIFAATDPMSIMMGVETAVSESRFEEPDVQQTADDPGMQDNYAIVTEVENQGKEAVPDMQSEPLQTGTVQEEAVSAAIDVKADESGNELGMPVMDQLSTAHDNNISQQTVNIQPEKVETPAEAQVQKPTPKKTEKEDGRRRLAARKAAPKVEKKPEPEVKEEDSSVEVAKPQKAAAHAAGKDAYWQDIIEQNGGYLNYYQAEIIRLVATEADLPRACKLLEKLIANKKK